MSYLLVFLGGGTGALARYGVGRIVGSSDLAAGGMPWATFVANVLACAVLALGLALAGRELLAREGQLLLLTGFCGGFPTFSTFAGELLDLITAGHYGVALTYLLASVVAGVAVLYVVLLAFPPR